MFNLKKMLKKTCKSKTICLMSTLFINIWFISLAQAKQQNESWYQQVWCDSHGGKSEFRLNDYTRIDCLTTKYAIEMDFAHKWHEAVGQALHYARKTGLNPGIVLVLKKPGDHFYITELNKTLEYFQLPVKVWQLGPWQ